MAVIDKIRTDPRGSLFDAMDSVRAGLLGLPASGQAFQPMTHFPDEDSGEIWFITSRETDLAKAVGSQSGEAQYIVVSKDHDFHASLSGSLVAADDPDKLDEIWSPVTGAWFEGRDDPDIQLLCFRPDKAALWASTDSSVRFGFEIIKANMMEDHQPDVGEHRVIDMKPGGLG